MPNAIAHREPVDERELIVEATQEQRYGIS
jgi:hypothetical protein